jgi:hypothetical protein
MENGRARHRHDDEDRAEITDELDRGEVHLDDGTA